jgi:hypothetical protein
MCREVLFREPSAQLWPVARRERLVHFDVKRGHNDRRTVRTTGGNYAHLSREAGLTSWMDHAVSARFSFGDQFSATTGDEERPIARRFRKVEQEGDSVRTESEEAFH